MALYRKNITKNRKKIVLTAGLILILLTAVALSGCTGQKNTENTPTDTNILPSEEFKFKIDQIISKDDYEFSSWGMMAVDTNSGKVLLSLDEDKLFTPGSTTKVFTSSSALEILGKDYRFKTPVYYKDDNLVLVASGDLAMGGRGADTGVLEYTTEDHVDAKGFGDCIIVESDPLSGLNSLAKQVHDAGITTVTDVAIDARLFEKTKLEDSAFLTPIVINDNLIDVTITPAKEGAAPDIDWRPKSSAYTVKNSIVTGKAGTEMSVVVPDYTGQTVIEITGEIPADSKPITLVSLVLVPEEFARSLFIDALKNAGVSVKSDSGGKNPEDILPAKDAYSDYKKAAELISPPFSEYVKVTLKVSQNLYANCMLGLIAAHEGYDIIDAGLYIEGDFLKSAGVNLNSLFLADGEGSSANRISPLAATTLTKYIAGTDNYQILKDSMPVLGVDGTLASGAKKGDPGYGEIYAKTGTSLSSDMKGEIFAYARGLLGYMKTENGNDITFVIYVNNVPGIKSINDLSGIVTDVTDISVLMYQYL
ncbi:MAG: D-alanyl-D-alanine carboxypeptidase/D-alanyl-D-alanine-endopeptidase [Methanomicrobiaceae archaeon]|nr:D-alanyl-D-alanine carboxypeptidase/D-alanyl-D-alanine-endopeptidase [Methanomicrobiaceae archaeon]